MGDNYRLRANHDGQQAPHTYGQQPRQSYYPQPSYWYGQQPRQSYDAQSSYWYGQQQRQPYEPQTRYWYGQQPHQSHGLPVNDGFAPQANSTPITFSQESRYHSPHYGNAPKYRQPYDNHLSTSRTPAAASVSQSQPDASYSGSNQFNSSSVVSTPSSASTAPPPNSLAQLEQLVVSGSGLPIGAAPGPKSSSGPSPLPLPAASGSGNFYNSLPTAGSAQNVYSHFPSPSPTPGQHPAQPSPQQQQNYYYYQQHPQQQQPPTQQPQSTSSWPPSQPCQMPITGTINNLGPNPGASTGFSPSMRNPQQSVPISSSNNSGVAKSPMNSQFSVYDNSQYSSPNSDNFSGSKQSDLTTLTPMQKFNVSPSFGSPVTPSQPQQPKGGNETQESDMGKDESGKELETFSNQSRNQSSPGSSFFGPMRTPSNVDNSNASSVVQDQVLNTHKKNDSINQQTASQQHQQQGPPGTSSAAEISFMSRPYPQPQHQSDPSQNEYMSQQMYSQSQQSYSHSQMSQFGSSYGDHSMNFDMSSAINDQPVMTQMTSYGPPPDQRMYDQSYVPNQGMDNNMMPPAPNRMGGEFGSGEMSDMGGMGYQPSPYDEPFSSEPPTKKKGKGRPKKDPAEPKKEKKPRQPRTPKVPRGRGRGGRVNMGDRLPPQALPPEFGESGYGMPPEPPVPDMYGPPSHHLHQPHGSHPTGPLPPGPPHGLPPHMSPGPPPHDPFRPGGPQMIAPTATQPTLHMHHSVPGSQTGMCLPQIDMPQPHQSHVGANSFDGLGQHSVSAPPSASSTLPPHLTESRPLAATPVLSPRPDVTVHPIPAPPVETLLDPVISLPPSILTSKSPAPPLDVGQSDHNRPDSKTNESGEGEKESVAGDTVSSEVAPDDVLSQSTSTSVENSAFVLPSSEDSSSLPATQSQDPLDSVLPTSHQSPRSPSLIMNQDSTLTVVAVAVAADEETGTSEPVVKRKGKKRKSKQEKESVGGDEVAEPAKKTKRSGGGKKKKKDKHADDSTSVLTTDMETTAVEPALDTETSSVPDEADSTTGHIDEATQQEGDVSFNASLVTDNSQKPKKGKGKCTPKGSKKPKLKEGKSSVKKKLPKIALAKFKGRKKKRLGSSDHNSDIEKTPPPSPDETESGIQKRRSGRVTKRTKYLDDVDLDLSGDDSKKEEEKKEVTTVVIDDTMVVEKIMCTRMGIRELEPENEEEEARFKEGKPPTVEVEEFYVKYKNLSYLHCDWRTEEELEKGDKRINQKIKRFKMKKDSNTSYDFLDDEPFNPDYCEVDRILDVNIVTEEIPIAAPAINNTNEVPKTATDGEVATVQVDPSKPTDADPSEEDLEKVNEPQSSSTDRIALPINESESADKSRENSSVMAPDTNETNQNLESVGDENKKPEKVVPSKTTTRTVRHYLVKWQALSYEESTWEMEDDLDPEKVKQFWKFREMPSKELLKHKKRPKPLEWKKLEQSPVYKNGNTLREYQLEGLNWLTFCWYNGRNCILADEMGLGKTIQSLTFINEMVKYGIRSPFLIIAPLSTIGNWQREFETWTDLNVITYHGSSASRNMLTEYEMYYKNEKGERIEGVYKFQVMITTFEVVLTDCLELREIVWRACIIDEAHRLKNRNCKLLEGLRLLQMEHRVLLTGTPLQNNVEELFSLLNFLEPSQFSSPESFMLDFGDLKTEEQVEKLQAILKPMMLRRLKEDVEKSLAPKEETIVEVELTNIQKKYYRAILERNFQFLSKGGTYANMPNLMNTMMELRKCCIHPFLINSAEEQITAEYKQQYESDPDSQLKCMIQASGKLVLIDKLLPRLRADGHRVLIFSQMVRCLDILEDYVIQKKYPYERIDGRVRGNMRQAAIDRFSKPGSDRFVFLLCTRAGGLGINLTAADTVIIFDSDWNPQNDLQAQARCHRIGQSKMVKVYRLICRNTYEREMFDKASLKLGLDKAVLQSMNTGQKGGGNSGDAGAPLSKKEVEELLRKGAYGAVMDDDNAGDKFCEEDIDQILTRRTQVITIDSGEKGSTFSRASFATSDNADIEIDDPNFWEKWAKKANIDSEEMISRNELIVQEPRRRTQTKRFGQDDGVMEMSEGDSSDDDEDNISGRTRGGRGRPVRGKKGKRGRGNGYERERDEDYLEEFGPGNWTRAECYKVEKALLTYGWGRWEEFVSMGNFRRRLTTQDVEDISRVLLLFSLRNYKGDEKVKSFILDLITPLEHVDKSAIKSPGSPTGSRGRKNRKSMRKTVTEELSCSDWASSDSYNPDVLLIDEQYRKHLSKQMNKLLLRVKLLHYLAHEIIGDMRDDVLRGVPARELPIPLPIADGDPPSTWWDEECDKSLLIGVFKHGYDRYNLMRQDTSLCFFHRCGPPDGAALLAEIQDDDIGRLEEDEDLETPATPATQESTRDDVDSESSGRLAFPSRADMNQRLRRVVTAYQKHSKRQEVRLAQQARHQQRLEKLERFEAAIKERELKKRETAQRKWSRREEADFYRVVSSYGVEFDRRTQQFDWNKFRTFSRLEKKVDETLTEYYKAFYAMCKRVTGRRLSEEEENLQISVDPISEERAARCLARIDLIRKIREEILQAPDLDEKLQLCQPSIDLPDWWVCGKHDKDLLIGASKYGLNRLDQSVMHDPDLSFREIIKNAEAEAKRLEEALIKENEKMLTDSSASTVPGDKEIMNVEHLNPLHEKDTPLNGESEIKQVNEDEKPGFEDGPVKLEAEERVKSPDTIEKSELTTDSKDEVETNVASKNIDEPVVVGENENGITHNEGEGCEKVEAKDPDENKNVVEDEVPKLENGNVNGHVSEEMLSSDVKDEDLEKTEKTEVVSVKNDDIDVAKEENTDQEKEKTSETADNDGTKETTSELKLKDEDTSLCEDKCNDSKTEEDGAAKSEVIKQQEKHLNAPAVLPTLPVKAVRWPKDRVLQMRLEQIVYCVEKNEWPSMRHTFFTLAGPSQSTPSIATADSSPRAVSPGSLSMSSVSREPTPHPTPDHTPRRELSPLPDYLFDSAGDSVRRRKRRRRRYDPETEKRMKLRNLLTQNVDQSQQHPFLQSSQALTSSSLKNKSAASQSAQSLLSHASPFHLPPNFFSSLPFMNSLRSDLRNDFLSDEKTASLLLGNLSRSQAQAVAQLTSSKHAHASAHGQGSSASGPPPAHQSSSKRNPPTDSLDLRFSSNPLLGAPPAPAHKINPKLPPPLKERTSASPVTSVLDLSSGPSLPKRQTRMPPLQPEPSQHQQPSPRSGKRIGSRLDAIALNLQAKKMLEEKSDPKESNVLSVMTRKSEKRKDSRLDQIESQLNKKIAGPPAAHSGSSTPSTSKNLSGMSDLLSKSLGAGLNFGSLFDTSRAGQSKHEASAILEQANAMKQNLNNWLESHPEFVRANPDLAAAAAAAMAFSPLSSGLPANTELLELPEGRRRGRRPKAETLASQTPVDQPGKSNQSLGFDDNVPVIHRQTGKRLSGYKAPSLQHLAEWLEKNPGYDIDPKWNPLSSEKFTNFKVPVSTPQGTSSGIRTRTSDRGGSRTSSSESATAASSSSSSRRTTAASLLAHAHGNTSNSTPTSGSSTTSFGFPSTSLASSLAGLNPNLLSGFPANMNMKMFLDSMAAATSTPISSSSPSSSKTSTTQTSGSSSSTTTSSSSAAQQSALSNFFPFAGLAGIAGLQNPLLGFPGLNFSGYPGLGSFSEEAASSTKSNDSKSSSRSNSGSKYAADKKSEKAGKSSGSGSSAQLFGSGNPALGSSAMPFLYPNPNFLYSGLGLGGFSGLPSSSPFASLTQSGLMNGLGGLSSSIPQSSTSSSKSGSKSKTSSRSSSGAPSGLSLSTASSLLSSTGIHPSSAAAAAAMGDSDDESLKSLMGHEDDDEDLNGDLDEPPSRDDSDSDYDAKPKRKPATKSKGEHNKGRKPAGSSSKTQKN